MNKKKTKTNKFLSRKLILTLLFTILGLILVLNDKLSGTEYMIALAANYGLYFGANILAKQNDGNFKDS